MTPSNTSKFVEDFAELMEFKLDQNRHKGDREGWLNDSVATLLSSAYEELNEVRDALLNDVAPTEVAHECADVANFMMMIADKYQENN